MSVKRSPPKLISGSESASGSVPNLSTYSDDTFLNVNLRKRKERPDDHDYRKDFADFRNEMMTFLQEFGKKQTENLEVIRKEMIEIKSEIKTIKLTTEKFTHQLDLVNTDIKKIKSQHLETQHKIEEIETELSSLKTQPCTSSSLSTVFTSEELIHELRDRCEREKNIVLIGIPEKNEKNPKLRRTYDLVEAVNAITLVYDTCPKPLRAIRLGKYIPNKNRPLKVCFDDATTPKILLRKRINLPENIQLYADQTPTQKKNLDAIKEELDRRTKHGEKDLIIKYIKGIPKIIINKPILQKN